MSDPYKWVKLMLENSKVVGALLLVLMSGLGMTSWTVFDQYQELNELKHPPIEVQIVEVPVNSGIEQLKIDVKKLKRWHE